MKFKEMTEEELKEVALALVKRDSRLNHLKHLNKEHELAMLDLAHYENYVRDTDALLNQYMKED